MRPSDLWPRGLTIIIENEMTIKLENDIVRKIFGPIFNTEREQWRINDNRALREMTWMAYGLLAT